MLRLDAVSYRYPGDRTTTVGPIDLEVPGGQLVLLTGPTGCGKSTLLRLAGGLLQRHGRGEFAGRVRIGEANPAQVAPSERVGLLGFVSQEPSDQIVAASIGDEIAFGLESAGWSSEAIQARIQEQLEIFDLPRNPLRAALALSGGQRQRLVVAAALAAQAPLLLLDEPLSQLDPVAALRLLGLLRKVADDGVTVLMVEHRVETCLPFCDRILVMDRGKVCLDRAGKDLPLEPLRQRGLAVPNLRDLEERSGLSLGELGLKLGSSTAEPTAPADPSEVRPRTVRLENLEYSYPRSSEPALRDITLSLYRGERVALLGGNGAGKSTLLAAIAGELGGSARSSIGRVVDVPQDPDLTLFCPTVADEIAYGPREQRLPETELIERVRTTADRLSIGDLLARPPQSLSRGQRLRCAVAAALSCQPDILLLDEPTSGQDADQVERMMAGLSEEGGDQRLLVFATHNVDLALRHATRVLVLEAGRIVADGPPGRVLSELDHGGALVLPPLATWCRDQGLAYGSVDDLLARGEVT